MFDSAQPGLQPVAKMLSNIKCLLNRIIGWQKNKIKNKKKTHMTEKIKVRLQTKLWVKIFQTKPGLLHFDFFHVC